MIKSAKRSFTLLELVVVIIIVGILSSIGFVLYSRQIERSRTAEAIAQISIMRQLTKEFYLKYGALDDMENSDVGVNDTCSSASYYRYRIGSAHRTSERVGLVADRCTSGGKTPNTDRRYYFTLLYYPVDDQSMWCCGYVDDGSSCFGLPVWSSGKCCEY